MQVGQDNASFARNLAAKLLDGAVSQLHAADVLADGAAGSGAFADMGAVHMTRADADWGSQWLLGYAQGSVESASTVARDLVSGDTHQRLALTARAIGGQADQLARYHPHDSAVLATARQSISDALTELSTTYVGRHRG